MLWRYRKDECISTCDCAVFFSDLVLSGHQYIVVSPRFCQLIRERAVIRDQPAPPAVGLELGLRNLLNVQMMLAVYTGSRARWTEARVGVASRFSWEEPARHDAHIRASGLPPQEGSQKPAKLVYSCLFPALASLDVVLCGRGHWAAWRISSVALPRQPAWISAFIKGRVDPPEHTSTSTETSSQDLRVPTFRGQERDQTLDADELKTACWILDFHSVCGVAFEIHLGFGTLS
ncbi:hypothetical protein Q8A73_016708 [Channa argus]|nr:hypothetical protein Q8A73_016708 [Channa argus]